MTLAVSAGAWRRGIVDRRVPSCHINLHGGLLYFTIPVHVTALFMRRVMAQSGLSSTGKAQPQAATREESSVRLVQA